MMKDKDIFEKLVSLLGRSENNPEVIEIFIQLGVKLPLKRPKKSERDNYLIEDIERHKFYLGMAYVDALPSLKNKKIFKENELIFSAITDIVPDKKNDNLIFPFGIKFGDSLQEVVDILGDYYDERDFLNSYFFKKDDIIISVEFDDDKKSAKNINYRLKYNFDE